MDEGIFPTVHFWMNFHTKNSKTNLPATNTLSWKLEVLRVTLNFSQFRIQAPYSLCTVSPQTEDQPKPSILKLLKVSWNRLYYKKIHTFNRSDHFLKILKKNRHRIGCWMEATQKSKFLVFFLPTTKINFTFAPKFFYILSSFWICLHYQSITILKFCLSSFFIVFLASYIWYNHWNVLFGCFQFCS